MSLSAAYMYDDDTKRVTIMKKKRLAFIVTFSFVLVAVVAGALYMIFAKTIYIPVKDCNPEKGILLAYIDGEPYYYDRVYLFKVLNAALPENPNAEEKKTALFSELAYLESVDDGNTVSYERLQKEIEIRKANASGWDDALEELKNAVTSMKNNGTYSAEDISEQEETLAEMEDYVQRYRGLWSQCTKGAGITEAQYWQKNLAYFKKGVYITKYTAKRGQDYIAMQEEENFESGGQQYVMADFNKLVKKYHVEIVDKDLN